MILGALLTVLVGSIVLAGLTVVEPVKLFVSQIQPPVVLEPGKHSGLEDVTGTIQVNITGNGTTAQITLHPTYQYTLYGNILNVTNNGTRSYNVSIIVEQPASIPGGWGLLLENTTTGLIAVVNLSANGTYSLGQLLPGQNIELWALFYIPEGTRLTAVNSTIYIAYSPSNETPVLPPGG